MSKTVSIKLPEPLHTAAVVAAARRAASSKKKVSLRDYCLEAVTAAVAYDATRDRAVEAALHRPPMSEERIQKEYI